MLRYELYRSSYSDVFFWLLLSPHLVTSCQPSPSFGGVFFACIKLHACLIALLWRCLWAYIHANDHALACVSRLATMHENFKLDIIIGATTTSRTPNNERTQWSRKTHCFDSPWAKCKSGQRHTALRGKTYLEYTSYAIHTHGVVLYHIWLPTCFTA